MCVVVLPRAAQRLLQDEFEKARDYKPQARDWLSSYWSGFMSPNQKARIRNTGALAWGVV